MDLVLARLFFVALLSGVCYFLHPFGLTGPLGALAGAGAACAVIIFELRVRALSLKRLIGAVVGSVLGIFGAALFCLVLRSAPLTSATSAVLQIFVLLLMTYVGLLVGAYLHRALPMGPVRQVDRALGAGLGLVVVVAVVWLLLPSLESFPGWPARDTALRFADYAALGGHVDHIRPLSEIVEDRARRQGNGAASVRVKEQA